MVAVAAVATAATGAVKERVGRGGEAELGLCRRALRFQRRGRGPQGVGAANIESEFEKSQLFKLIVCSPQFLSFEFAGSCVALEAPSWRLDSSQCDPVNQ